jgi:hypothetical protein
MNLLAAGQRTQGKKELEAAVGMKLDTADAQRAHEVLAEVN